MIIHEVIHAMFSNSAKEIWLSEQGDILFMRGKGQQVTLYLDVIGASTVLGILPFLIWYVVAPFLSVEVSVCCANELYDGVGGGDFVNVYHAIRHAKQRKFLLCFTVWIEEE